MKILNKEEFMKKPAGTVYFEGIKWCFGGLSIKGETIEGQDNFYYLELGCVESDNTIEWLDRLDDMLEHKNSYPHEYAMMRSQFFDFDDEKPIFLVPEVTDLIEIREYINKAIELEKNKCS